MLRTVTAGTFFLGPGTWHHRNWSQWCFTPHIWGWYCAASALSSLPRWACWFRHCSGRAHGEGEHLPATCQKMGFARPNDFETIVLMVGGIQASFPKSPPALLVCRPLASRRGALVQSVAFPHPWASFNIRQAEYFKVGAGTAKSPVLEYRTRNGDRRERDRESSGYIFSCTWGLVPRWGSWGMGQECSWTPLGLRPHTHFLQQLLKSSPSLLC